MIAVIDQNHGKRGKWKLIFLCITLQNEFSISDSNKHNNNKTCEVAVNMKVIPVPKAEFNQSQFMMWNRIQGHVLQMMQF